MAILIRYDATLFSKVDSNKLRDMMPISSILLNFKVKSRKTKWPRFWATL